MIVELGHFALMLAFATALSQLALPLWGALQRDPALQSMARYSAFVTFALVVLSYLALTYAYIGSDFSVTNVVMNSHSSKPNRKRPLSGRRHRPGQRRWLLAPRALRHPPFAATRQALRAEIKRSLILIQRSLLTRPSRNTPMTR